MSAPRSPSGDESAGAPPAGLIAVIGATLALRLLVGGCTHLTEDEAYYRLWSMAPALGYYDHPPMIAWWIWLGRQIAGDDALGVRILPALSVALTSLLVFDIARLVGAGRALAARAGVWFNAMPLVLAGGFLAVPDAPASLFWTTTVWCALKAGAGDKPVRWWAAAGAAAGLAALSKYSALFIAPGMVLWLAASAEGRGRLRTPGPWLAALVAGAIFAVNVVWNADHGWLTFAKQFGRVTPRQFAPRYLVELLAGQFLLLNPLIAVFGLSTISHRPSTGSQPAVIAPLLAVSAPFAVYLVLHSVHDRVQAHWPAPLYPLAAVCAAVGAQRLADRAGWRRAALAAPILGFGLGALALAALVAPGSVLGRYDLALPVRGWTGFAARIESLRRQSGAAWVGTTSYGLASELELEPVLKAPVAQLAERDRWRNLASGPTPDLAAPGLAVDLTRRVNAASLARCFTTVRPVGVIARGDPGEAGKAYVVFLVAGPRRNILALGC